jgi:hypothetical protein
MAECGEKINHEKIIQSRALILMEIDGKPTNENHSETFLVCPLTKKRFTTVYDLLVSSTPSIITIVSH